MKQPNTFYVRTYGCQMNELDSDIMAGQLVNRGMTRVQTEDEADLLLFNTCSIRDLAERKVMGKLGQLGKKSAKEALIGVTGCMANAKKEAILDKLPHVDFVLGTNNLHHLNEVLDNVLATGKPEIRVDDMFTHELDYLAAQRENPISAYISIIRGCDKYCTYCVVPYTRGPEVSRHPDLIIEECKKLAGQGYKEVTLLGQNVNSYGKDKPEWNTLFHDLLYQIDKIPGIERIRFMTSHPIDITRELMEAIRDLSSACEFVHFPLQAGSSRILKKMHRLYTLEQYLEKVALLKELVPNVTLGTDIIVGFPTETDEEFEMTYNIMKEIEYSVAFIYTYSARKGTPAMRWKDDIPESIKDERLQRLTALQEPIYKKQRLELLHKEVEVLVEKPNFKDGNFMKGRTRCWKNVLFKGEESLIGTLQTVKIHTIQNQTMLGERVSKLVRQ